MPNDCSATAIRGSISSAVPEMSDRFLPPSEPQKHDTEIRLRRGKARIQRQRSRITRRGLLVLAAAEKRVSQIVMGFGVFRIELDCFSITEQSLIRAARP